MMQEVAEDVLVETEYHGCNVGCVVTYEGAVLVDAPIVPSQGKAWRERLRDLMGAEFLYIFHTHGHPTHCIGNSQFADAAPIANELAYRNMVRFTPTRRQRVLDMLANYTPELAQELEGFEVVGPEITFDEGLVLYKGDRVLRMMRVGGHTPASSVLFVEDVKVLFAGDVVVTDRPPTLEQESSEEWLAGLRRIRELAPSVIVPGHGAVCGLEAVDQVENFLLRVREGVQSLLEEGRSRAETATRMLPLLNEFDIEERWRKRTERSFRSTVGRVYEEMKAAMQEQMQD